MKYERLVFPDKQQCDYETIELLKPIGSNEVLIKNEVSLVSAGTELAMFTRSHRGFDVEGFNYASYPFYPGYATVGEVVEVGAEVTSITPGQRVFHRAGHGEMATVDANGCVVIPEGLASSRAVFLAMARISFTTVMREPVTIGESCLVIGSGLIGALAVQILKLTGALNTAIADLNNERLRIAKALGVDWTINPQETDLEAWLAQTNPDGFPYVVEAVGAIPSLQLGLKTISERGRLVLLGSARDACTIDPYFDIHKPGIRITGAHEIHTANDRHVSEPLLLKWLMEEKLNVDLLHTQDIPFTDALKAYQNLSERPNDYLGVCLVY